jgi:hypothetical protein
MTVPNITMETAVEVFLDMFDHLPLKLSMLKTFVDLVELDTRELLEYLFEERSLIYISWYKAAIIYSESKGKSLRERCKGERNLRVAWKEFIKKRVVQQPTVPDIPK